MSLSVIGYLTVSDYSCFIDIYNKTTLRKIEYYKNLQDKNMWSGVFRKIYDEDADFRRDLSNIHDRYYQKRDGGWYTDQPLETFEKDFKRCFEYMSEFNQKFNIIFTASDFAGDTYYLITFGNYAFLLFDNPYIFVEMLKDYSDKTIAQIKGQIKESDLESLVPKEAGNISVKGINETINSKNSDIAKLKQEMDDVKSAKYGELAALQEEIDKKMAELESKKQAMLLLLEQKKAEMQVQMEQLENQLFVLESEIYAIRCFLGEVVNFTKLSSGLGASEDTPIILFQKVRYLDEEMGKLCSIYDFDGNDLKLFEKFIANNQECLDTFCPSKKCISLVRCTKNNYYHSVNGEIANMLEAYKAFHGKTIGILIRDGDNLFMGWTDEEKINIKEDMFFVPGVKTYYDQEDAQQASENISDKYEIVSRYFVFSILQGVLENGGIIKLSGKHCFTRPDNMIIYSAADNWITDNKYGSFSELLDKYSQEDLNKIGDEIIVIKGLRPDRSRDSWFNSKNDRGIGYADRTHDVSTSDGEIHKINHILSYPHYYIYYTQNNATHPPMYTTPGGKPYHYRREITTGVPTEIDIKNIQAKDNITVVEHGYDYNYEYFISLFKDLAWDKTKEDYKVLPKANFQIYSREYVNLTFFNSVWITYVIQNKNIGSLGWASRGPDVDYAYVIKYLNIMRKHLIQREVEEAAMINAFMPEDHVVNDIKDWPVVLSEWKFNNNVHKIGKRAAKQFAKFISALI